MPLEQLVFSGVILLKGSGCPVCPWRVPMYDDVHMYATYVCCMFMVAVSAVGGEPGKPELTSSQFSTEVSLTCCISNLFSNHGAFGKDNSMLRV